MTTRVIILTGAPRPSSLSWDESELLQDESAFSTHESERVGPHWRSLAPISNVTRYTPPVGEDSFFTLGAIQRYSGDSISVDSSEEEVLSLFYDHSLAFHERINAGSFSEYSLNDDSNVSATSAWGERTSDLVSKPSSNDEESEQSIMHTPSIHLNDIEDIPTARYLESIAPHTINVNLIAAVITVLPRRRVRTRWGREMDIAELLVGDESRAGFRITCWVQPLQEDSKAHRGTLKSALSRTLETLRPRDIVLLRSVALNVFQGKVYGQSMRNNETMIDLLHRQPAGPTDAEGAIPTRVLIHKKNHSDPQVLKASRVRAWLLDFIGHGFCGDGSDQARHDIAEDRQVPPDTQL